MNNAKQPINPSMWTKIGNRADDYKPLNDGQKTGYEVKFGGLTKIEYTCIHNLVPDTGDPELDEVIRRARRQQFVENIACALTANTEWMKRYKRDKYLMHDSITANVAIERAGELIKQLDGEAGK